ncbi:hypothetical protein ACSS6W_002116 [Trichoderma asperelloides]
MHAFTILTTIAVVAVATTASVTPRDTLPKANEYKSGDCSGNINFGHHSGDVTDVTMDDTSHSVYLAASGKNTWEAWDGKTYNGGGCTGNYLGLVPHLSCLNLDNGMNGRIRCVRFHPQ